MFVIVVYDVNQKRVSKVHKICKKYLHSIQRSVFEGSITRDKLRKLQQELEKQIVCQEDSVCIYEIDSEREVWKEKLGKDERKEYIL